MYKPTNYALRTPTLSAPRDDRDPEALDFDAVEVVSFETARERIGEGGYRVRAARPSY